MYFCKIEGLLKIVDIGFCLALFVLSHDDFETKSPHLIMRQNETDLTILKNW